ncbi:hypothetical protein ACJ41O_007248 [Fusarium nematophilum]
MKPGTYLLFLFSGIAIAEGLDPRVPEDGFVKMEKRRGCSGNRLSTDQCQGKRMRAPFNSFHNCRSAGGHCCALEKTRHSALLWTLISNSHLLQRGAPTFFLHDSTASTPTSVKLIRPSILNSSKNLPPNSLFPARIVSLTDGGIRSFRFLASSSSARGPPRRASRPGHGAYCEHEIWGIIQANKNNEAAMHEIRAPAWVMESGMRGIFSILQTCILTLVACIYTALHLNVPNKTGFWRELGVKLGWTMVALFAPELVLYTALGQFISAKKLVHELGTLSRSTGANRHFDIKYGFFVVMGWFRVKVSALAEFLTLPDINSSWKDSLAKSGQRSTLQITPGGILKLAEHGYWFDIPPEDIDDRSKANGIQKLLVIVEVFWLAMSCVVRAIYGFPLSLLEIHTMVHVVCALAMYSLWFKVSHQVSTLDVAKS